MSKEIIRTLQQYVPAQIVRRLAIDPTPIKEATAERFSAAVLFVDITDFTALADRLDNQGLGSEYLANLLNDCFGQLINIIHVHGGEVTKFAGDAIIALWPVTENVARQSKDAQLALAYLARKAAQCGLAIQQELWDFRTADGSNLYLQIGIGAGDVYSVYLGGVFARWEFLLSGTPLVQMSVAKEMAKPGSVVLSPEVRELVKEYTSTKPLRKGFVELKKVSSPLPLFASTLPDLDDSSKNSIQAYVPAAILSRLEAGHEDWLSEIRRVAVMFIKLPQYGTSIKHPYVRTIPEAQAVMKALQTALYRYAGSINKFNVDDKGITLVAGMGLPPLSHGDDSARAIHAAIEMQVALEKLGRKSAIGITTGWVFCGPIGNNIRREYTVVGTTVNMAARLMQASEQILANRGLFSAILCDEATYTEIKSQTSSGRTLANRLDFRSMKLTGVKGKSEPISAFSPSLKKILYHRNHDIQTKKVKICGYEQERNRLNENLLELASAGVKTKNNLIIVEGTAGSGKSLIVNDLVDQANLRGVRTLVSEGHLLEQTTPYFAWRSIFGEVFRLNSIRFDQQTVRSHVLSQLPAIRGERGYPAFAIGLSPLLNDVLPIDFPETQATSHMTEAEKQHTTKMFYLRLLQRDIDGTGLRRRRPTLLILDNGQWLDEWSWSLVLEISNQIQSSLTVVATRPLSEQGVEKRLKQVCSWLASRQDVLRLRLPDLDAQETAALICEQLKVQETPTEVLEILRHKTNGHPLFSLELTRVWHEMGLIQMDRGTMSLTSDRNDLDSVPVPSNVRQINIGRLESLVPDQQLLLKVASVLGRRFHLDQLENLLPIEHIRENLRSEIAALVEFGLLRAVKPEDDLYQFKNYFLYEATLSLLPKGTISLLQRQMKLLSDE